MERNLPTPAPENSPKPSEKAGEKSKSKDRKFRAPIPDAKITKATEVKETPKREAPAPKVPLYELFEAEAHAKEAAEADAKENADAKPEKTRSSKKKSTKGSAEKPAKKADETKDAGTVENTDTVEDLEELTLPEAVDAEAADAEPRQEPEPTDEGLLIIDRDTDKNFETAGTSLEEANEYRDDEPAPVVAPPIMFDIPLRPTEQAAAVEAPMVAEAVTEPEPVIPPLETAVAGPVEAKLAEAALVNTGELEQQRVEADMYSYSAAAAEAPKAADKRIAEREKADAEYYAEKRGLSRGVASGVFVGYIFGRRRGRMNAERAAKVEIKKRDDKIEGLEANQQASENRSNFFSGTIERLQGQVRGLEQRAKAVITRSEKQPAERAEKKPKPTYEYNRGAPETMKNPENTEKPKAKPETKPEDTEITEETYAAPEGKRFETSAWHRYEVDKQTGKLVEDPESVYGKEFKQEQKQERMQSKPADAASTQQLGHAVVVGANVDEPKTTVVDSVTAHTQANLQPELNPYQPPHQKIEPKEMLKEVKKHIQQPIIWLAALVIVALLFAFGILH